MVMIMLLLLLLMMMMMMMMMTMTIMIMIIMMTTAIIMIMMLLIIELTLWLFVADVNEPPANIQLSNIKVAENSPVGTPVGKISFDDPEKSRGDQSYAVSVTGFSSVPFTLGGNDGRTLMVGGNLNHETTPEVDVTVRVGDSGGLFTDATFQIQVEGEKLPRSFACSRTHSLTRSPTRLITFGSAEPFFPSGAGVKNG